MQERKQIRFKDEALMRLSIYDLSKRKSIKDTTKEQKEELREKDIVYIK